uniref:Butyrophilin subfamily 3 member A2-like Ig-C domain-containing protein n=1 Tax=Erpetoichthys calabaricus TaxID=27687 RepID=A0A8C4STG1_ERPCA
MQAFKGRTALFPEEFVSGNVSLRLQDVRISDGGLYRCLVASGLWNEEAHITLNVEVVGTQPSISISTAEDQQTRLECSSEKWSSRPEVTWRDTNGVDVTSQSTLTVQRDNEGLLRVSSVIPINRSLTFVIHLSELLTLLFLSQFYFLSLHPVEIPDLSTTRWHK